MFAHKAVNAATATKYPRPGRRIACPTFSAAMIAVNRNSQLSTWGRASQWIFVVDSIGAASRQAIKKFPSRTQFSRNHSHTLAPIAIV